MPTKEYRPTLAQLRTFVTIAENKHFGAAAQKLNISQPSLSQALVALEQGLCLQLIERSTRRVIVTTAGERLLPYAKATLDAAEAFLANSRGASGTLAGPLAIGIIPTIAPYILPELLVSIREEYPDLEPRIVEEQTDTLVQKLRDGQLDMAVLALPADAPGITEEPLYKERFDVVVPDDHPFAGRKDLRLSGLEELDLLLLDDGHCLRDQIIDLCRQAQVNPTNASNSVTRASSLTTVMQLIIGKLGATLIPESALATEADRDGLAVATFADDVTAEREVGLIYRNSTARADDFRSFGSLVTAAYENALQRSRSSIK